MKRFFFVLVLIVFFQSFSFSQLTLGGRYLRPNFDSWNKSLTFKQGDPRYIYENAFRVDIGYWFELRNIRIEFNPQVEYSNFTQKVKDTKIISSKLNEKFQTNRLGISVSTNVYFLNFKGECDCPTIDKDGNFFKKGLFVFLAPVVNYNLNSYSYESVATGEKVSTAFNSISYGGRVGMGFDIGASRLVTITPMFSYSYIVDNQWDGLTQSIYNDNNEIVNEVPNLTLDNSNLGEFAFGVRILFRLDNFYKYTRRSYR